MKQYRLNRLFNPLSGKCFDVAIDHGFFNEASFLGGIENIRAAVNTIVHAGPDAIQLTPGQAKYLQQSPGKQKPSLVLRVDVANVYGPVVPGVAFSKMIEEAALAAVKADAVCVCVNLFSIPGAPTVTAECIENILRLKNESDRYAMPMMVEPLIFRENDARGGYMVDGDIKKILPLVRQAVELGADIIKADPTTEVTDYHQVIEIAGDIPVLVRGGSKAADEEILQRTRSLLDQGASGIVYGRNIIQHADPFLITQTLMDMVHRGISVQEALGRLQKK